MQPTVLGLAFNLPNGSSGKYLLTQQDQAQASLHYLLQQWFSKGGLCTAAFASPENLLAMQSLEPHRRPTEGGAQQFVF